MIISFSVKTRKDGSIGIPKSQQRRMGINPHTQMECQFDTSNGVMTVTPKMVVCQCCGKHIAPGSNECDPIMQTCRACTMDIEESVANGYSVRAAVRKQKEKCAPVGRRDRK